MSSFIRPPAKKSVLHLNPKQPTTDSEPLPRSEDEQDSEQPLQQRARSVQEPFLTSLQEQQVAVYLTSGIRLTGILRSFDRYTLLVEHDGVQQSVFKHLVASIMPDLSLSRGERSADSHRRSASVHWRRARGDGTPSSGTP